MPKETIPWFQHGDYFVYTQERKMLKHVWNAAGHYEEAPRAG